MTSKFTEFSARLREFIRRQASRPEFGLHGSDPPAPPKPLEFLREADDDGFEHLAKSLFDLQFQTNLPFRRLCEARRATPESVEHWSEIPAVPTASFKEFEFSCLPWEERTTVFHSSGTTAHRPSRHFHSRASLAVYEASLLPWFQVNVLGQNQSLSADPQPLPGSAGSGGRRASEKWELAILTPNRIAAPHSSLVHMFEAVRRAMDAPRRSFLGRTTEDDSWALDFDRTVQMLREAEQNQSPVLLLGTAFSFVHLLDFLGAHQLRFELAADSRLMETGGYKGRSRELSKHELHRLISERLGIPASRIVCEYGMSELSSQAYDLVAGSAQAILDPPSSILHPPGRCFRFPPWARPVIVSPETGCEVAEGETGLIRVFDLANVFSVMAVQTEDLAIRRGTGFELIGRSIQAELRGCSLNLDALCRAS